MRIDSHQHFWRYNASGYGWIDDSMSCLRRDFLPENLKVELDAAGFDGAIAVQARQTLEETRWLLDLVAAAPHVFGVVGWVDLRSLDVRSQIRNSPRIRNFLVSATLSRASRTTAFSCNRNSCGASACLRNLI